VERGVDNLVTTAGADFLLNCVANVTSVLAQPYVGLITSGTPTAASTMGTPIFTETASSVVATRGTPPWTAITGTTTRSKACSAISFSVVTASSVAITGCFLVTGSGASNVVGNTGGTLYSAGAFTGGTKTVSSGDTLNVTYTASNTPS